MKLQNMGLWINQINHKIIQITVISLNGFLIYDDGSVLKTRQPHRETNYSSSNSCLLLGWVFLERECKLHNQLNLCICLYCHLTFFWKSTRNDRTNSIKSSFDAKISQRLIILPHYTKKDIVCHKWDNRTINKVGNKHSTWHTKST